MVENGRRRAASLPRKETSLFGFLLPKYFDDAENQAADHKDVWPELYGNNHEAVVGTVDHFVSGGFVDENAAGPFFQAPRKQPATDRGDKHRDRDGLEMMFVVFAAQHQIEGEFTWRGASQENQRNKKSEAPPDEHGNALLNSAGSGDQKRELRGVVLMPRLV